MKVFIANLTELLIPSLCRHNFELICFEFWSHKTIPVQKKMEICYLCIMRMLLLLFCLIMPAVPSVFSIQGNASDQEAVIGFMSAIATYDPAQSLPTSWKPNVSVCEWTGITCRRGTQRVVTVDVGSMGLQGTISPLLGNLSFLRILDLRNNSFHGHIPYQRGSLFRLKLLALSANQIQGSIPPTLGGCRSLTIFSMYSNHLDGNIPSEICVLSKLQYMALEYNNLTGTIPGCLGNMSSLNQ